MTEEAQSMAPAQVNDFTRRELVARADGAHGPSPQADAHEGRDDRPREDREMTRALLEQRSVERGMPLRLRIVWFIISA